MKYSKGSEKNTNINLPSELINIMSLSIMFVCVGDCTPHVFEVQGRPSHPPEDVPNVIAGGLKMSSGII